jgi:hypothetical protein
MKTLRIISLVLFIIASTIFLKSFDTHLTLENSNFPAIEKETNISNITPVDHKR